MTNEIFYCARCRRVILPREIAEGRYHIVDGDSVCTQCFTRLSRRLRTSGGVVEQPKPVNLADIPIVPSVPDDAPGGEEQSEGEPEPREQAPARASGRERESRRVGPASRGKMLIPAAFFLLGLLAGAIAFLVLRAPRRVEADAPAGPKAPSAGQR